MKITTNVNVKVNLSQAKAIRRMRKKPKNAVEEVVKRPLKGGRQIVMFRPASELSPS